MKKIAFDVQGTLKGSKQDLVLKLLKGFEAKGYKIAIWSNWYPYAVQIAKDLNINAELLTKYGRDEEDPNGVFDLAIEDDRSQTWLAAHDFLFVDQIDEEMVQKMLKDF